MTVIMHLVCYLLPDPLPLEEAVRLDTAGDRTGSSHWHSPQISQWYLGLISLLQRNIKQGRGSCNSLINVHIKIIVIYCESVHFYCCYNYSMTIFISINLRYKMPVCTQLNIYREERINNYFGKIKNHIAI